MSYDIDLVDEKGEVLVLPEGMTNIVCRQGTYAVGGKRTAEINITYNYSKHFCRVLTLEEPLKHPFSYGETDGIRILYGMKAMDSIALLTKAVLTLGNDVSDDYWEPTEGNAREALIGCLSLALNCPHGIWRGD